MEEFQKVDKTKIELTPTKRLKLQREFMLQRLQNFADLPGLEEFQAIDRNRLPKEYHNFQGFVNQSATSDSSATKDLMVDWNAPIKIKLVLLPDNVT